MILKTLPQTGKATRNPNDFKLRVEIVDDNGKRSLKIGNYVFTEYVKFDNARQILSRVNIELERKVGRNFKEYLNKSIYAAIGTTQSKFLRLVRGMMFEIFVSPYDRTIVSDFCIRRRSIYVPYLKLLSLHYDCVKQCYDDGIKNIAPIVLITGKSPKQLKEEYKGVWKSLCKNSFSKNKLIARRLIRSGKDTECLRLFSQAPSSLLEYLDDPYVIEYLKNNFKGEWKNKLKMMREGHVFQDMCQMKGEYNFTFSKWSPRRVHEEHEKLIRKNGLEQVSDIEIAWLKKLPIGNFHYKGYDVYLLNKESDIALEGYIMRHCVASYAKLVKRENYLVFSVRKGEKRISTIGINKWGTSLGSGIGLLNFENPEENPVYNSGLFVFNQHYGPSNTVITDKTLQEIPEFIEETLNQSDKDSNSYADVQLNQEIQVVNL